MVHHAAMAHAVYCSNIIEQVGALEFATSNICHRVLAGERVIAEDIRVGLDSLQEHLNGLIPDTKEQTIDNVVLSRREILQYARAMCFILNAVVNASSPFHEVQIKRTHATLVKGLDIHTHP